MLQSHFWAKESWGFVKSLDQKAELGFSSGVVQNANYSRETARRKQFHLLLATTSDRTGGKSLSNWAKSQKDRVWKKLLFLLGQKLPRPGFFSEKIQLSAILDQEVIWQILHLNFAIQKVLQCRFFSIFSSFCCFFVPFVSNSVFMLALVKFFLIF